MGDDHSIEELEFVKQEQERDTVLMYLRNKDEINFSVGDYLIEQVNRDDEGWETTTISSVSKIPKRFICFHQDEYGVKYVRALSSKGERLPYMRAVTNLNAWDYIRYVVDPEYAEHLIFNGEEEYDFASEKKKERAHRNKISRLNKKLVTMFPTKEAAWKHFQAMSIGDTFYMGWSLTDTADRKFELIEKEERVISVRSFKNDYKFPMYDKDLEGRMFFFQEPHSYETI